jgi:hypothetical protein
MPIQCYDRKGLVLLKAIAPVKTESSKNCQSLGINYRERGFSKQGDDSRIVSRQQMARRPTAWQRGTNGGRHIYRWWQQMRTGQVERRVKAEAQGQSERGKFVLTS